MKDQLQFLPSMNSQGRRAGPASFPFRARSEMLWKTWIQMLRICGWGSKARDVELKEQPGGAVRRWEGGWCARNPK